jgi:hypothetical protein
MRALGIVILLGLAPASAETSAQPEPASVQPAAFGLEDYTALHRRTLELLIAEIETITGRSYPSREAMALALLEVSPGGAAPVRAFATAIQEQGHAPLDALAWLRAHPDEARVVMAAEAPTFTARLADALARLEAQNPLLPDEPGDPMAIVLRIQELQQERQAQIEAVAAQLGLEPAELLQLTSPQDQPAPVTAPTSVEPPPQPPPWLDDLPAAEKRAQAEGRCVLAYWAADWCAACKELDHLTWTDAKLKALLEQRFLAVRVDCTHSNPLATQHGIMGLPTVTVRDAEGAWTQVALGYLDAAEMKAALEEACPVSK